MNPFQTIGNVFKSSVAKPGDAELLRRAAKITRKIWDGRRIRKTRMYDAAVNTRINTDFPVAITSANAEIFVSLNATRARARKLTRDNPYAAAIQWAHVINVAGEEPFRLEMRVGKKDDKGKFIEEKDTNQEIQDWWKEVGKKENCLISKDKTRSEFYWTCIAAIVESGEIYARHWRAYPNNQLGYAIEEIESDRIDHFFNRPTGANNSQSPNQLGANGNQIIMSHELDQWGAPIAIWVLARHPGDVYAYSNNPSYRERVPASDMVHFANLRLRPGQIRGMPKLSPVVQRLHRIEQYDIAEMTAAITHAIKIGFFIKKNTTDEYVGDKEEDGIKLDELTPGINMEELPEGYEMQTMDPNHPVEAYESFTDQNLRSVAQGTFLAHSTVSGNYANMSFSTGRLEKGPEKDTFKLLQNHMRDNIVLPHFCKALQYSIMTGYFAQKNRKTKVVIGRLEEFCNSAMWHAKRWPYINPLQDVQADGLRVQFGFDSRGNIIAESERGGDTETVDSEIATDKEIDEAHDLDFSQATPVTPPVEGDERTPQPPPRKGGKQTLKKSLDNLEHTLRTLAESETDDPDHKTNLEEFLTLKSRRNGHLKLTH